jgi:hypothetical protein
MKLKTGFHQFIIILIVLAFVLIQGVGAISVSYSETTNTEGAYSSSMGSSISNLNSNLNIDTITVTGSSNKAGSHVTGNESGAFTVDEPPSSDPDFGDIWVKSSPSGAQILLNGFTQPNLTPMLVTMLNPGKYTLVVKLDGFEPKTQEIEAIKGKVKTYVADFDGKLNSTDKQASTPSSDEPKSEGVWT